MKKRVRQAGISKRISSHLFKHKEITDLANKKQIIYTPDNEPYLGRETVRAFDNLIITCMESNKRIAPYTHKIEKSELQEAACKIIPQGISISLSIRELVRQGYLFGARF